MGAYHPSYVKEELERAKEEFERTHEAMKCPTCGGTYHVRKDNPS